MSLCNNFIDIPIIHYKKVNLKLEKFKNLLPGENCQFFHSVFNVKCSYLHIETKFLPNF